MYYQMAAGILKQISNRSVKNVSNVLTVYISNVKIAVMHPRSDDWAS